MPANGRGRLLPKTWPQKTAYLVLVDPRITEASLRVEMRTLEAALRPESTSRLHIVITYDCQATLSLTR